MPASVLDPNALTTYETVREMLARDESEQTLIEQLINAASAMAEGPWYANRILKARDLDVILDGTGRSLLQLPAYPIQAVTAVHVDPSRTFDANTEITNFVTLKNVGQLYRTAGWPLDVQNVKVVFRAGLDPVPWDLQHAIVEVVNYNLSRLGGAGSRFGPGIKSMSGPDGLTTQYELTVPMNAQRVFESYRSVA
jgi:hypothetical protein